MKKSEFYYLTNYCNEHVEYLEIFVSILVKEFYNKKCYFHIQRKMLYFKINDPIFIEI